ncbi:MAG: hypothetical protein LW817_08800, partial [Candidatus Caenarcaniphilales bacterium]|nr:hypothetical protein [Candidatus Caenarcaniphilales bacterium]
VNPDAKSDSKKENEEKTPPADQKPNSPKTNTFNLNIFNFDSPMKINVKGLSISPEAIDELLKIPTQINTPPSLQEILNSEPVKELQELEK